MSWMEFFIRRLHCFIEYFCYGSCVDFLVLVSSGSYLCRQWVLFTMQQFGVVATLCVFFEVDNCGKVFPPVP